MSISLKFLTPGTFGYNDWQQILSDKIRVYYLLSIDNAVILHNFLQNFELKFSEDEKFVNLQVIFHSFT